MRRLAAVLSLDDETMAPEQTPSAIGAFAQSGEEQFPIEGLHAFELSRLRWSHGFQLDFYSLSDLGDFLTQKSGPPFPGGVHCQSELKPVARCRFGRATARQITTATTTATNTRPGPSVHRNLTIASLQSPTTAFSVVGSFVFEHSRG